MPKHLQQLLFICLLLWAMGMMTAPTLAQSDATCEAIVQNAWQTTHTNCQLVRLNQVCYGNANVLTTARTASSLSLTQPGQVGSGVEFQSILASGYNQASRHYGVSLLTIPTNTNDRTTLQVYGNALLENLTAPLVELPFTVGTLGNIHITPSMSSQVIASMVSGDSLIGLGRVEVSGMEWIKMVSKFGSGWVPAFVVKETALVGSLSALSYEAVETQSLTRMKLTLASKDDRPCANVPDSGLFIQVPNSTLLELNGVKLVIDRTVTAWVQAVPNNTIDIYALQGVLSVESAGVAVSVSAGQFTTVPLGLDGFAMSVPTQARTYLNEKVRVLPLATSPLPEGVVISPGTNDLGVAVSALPAAEPTAGLPVTNSEVVLATTPDGIDPGMLAGLVVNPEATPLATVESVVVAPVVEVVTAPVTANSALSAFAQSIQARGSIRIGVNGSFPTFSMRIDDTTYEGFEVEIAKEVVRRLFGDGVSIEWVKVSSRQQPDALISGTIDLMIRNTVFAPDRTSWGEWTNTFYFVDGQRFMVRADSGITTSDQLVGRSVAVQDGTLAEQTLNDSGLGVTVMPIQATLIEVFAALQDGQVDAVSDNWATLEALRATAPNATDYQIMGDLLTSETYSIVVPLGQTAFRDEVDATLAAIISDGTWRTLYDASFDSSLPPTAELVFSPVAIDTAAIETVVVEQVAVQEVVPVVEPVVTDVVPTPSPTTNAAIPLSGRIPVRIFTVPEQTRDIELTPEADGTMMVKLIRLGEVVYSSRYKLAEDGRWLNVRNSFENVQFSATAGDESLGCNREADVRGFLNGASFEGKLNCQP